MGAKVTFLTPQKQIQPTTSPDSDGIISIDMQVDVYSDGKEDWTDSDYDLNKFKFPIEAIGGNPVAGGTLGTTYVISEDWHFLPYDTDHTFVVEGNVYTEDGSTLVDAGSDATISVELATTLNPPGLGLTIIQDTVLANILKMTVNKQTLDSDGVLTIYDDDGITTLYTQTVTDKDGNVITLDDGTPARRTAG